MIILQTFADFGTSQIIYFVGILSIILFAAMKIRSVITTVTWGFTAIILVMVMQFDLGIQFFWLSLIITIVSLMVSMTIYVYLTRNI